MDRERTFRLHCAPEEISLVEELLREQGYHMEPEPFSPLARRVVDAEKGAPPLGSSLAARFGLIYIQDKSSMLPPLALSPPSGSVVLDMCSAPGGKTSFLAQLAGDSGFVLGNEPNHSRLATLRRNLLGLNALTVGTCSYPGQSIPLPDGCLRQILLDPPCSGWGTTEKHPRVKQLWKGDKVEPLITLQRALLTEAVRLLAPGGSLVYSTCTTNPRENEEQVVFAQDQLGLTLVPLSPFPGFVFREPSLPKATGSLCVDEEGSGSQGHFVARLHKPISAGDVSGDVSGDVFGEVPGQTGLSERDAEFSEDRDVERPDQDTNSLTPPQEEGGPDWSRLPPGQIRCFGDTAFFLPSPALNFLATGLRWQGFPLGRASGETVRTTPRLRRLLPPSDPEYGFHVDEVRTLTGLLSGQSITLTGTSKKQGRMAFYFRGLPLGWLKVSGGRVVLPAG
jgi:16S rRNA C967 or C1407 C5-methylase (RsmB/RsmF family)